MPKKKEELHDPTLPFTEIEIGGKTYKMCLDHGALCDAEEALSLTHPEINLLLLLPQLRGQSSRKIFALSLRHFHPELSYEKALALVGPDTYMQVADAVYTGYYNTMPAASMGEQESQENPQ